MQEMVSWVTDMLPSSGFEATDITAVYCLRAYADNPWVLERLRLVGEHYTPRPSVLICDFGSEKEYARQIEDICAEFGFAYLHVADYELYSPAAAHNRAFEATRTDLIFFCDIDTFGRATMFQDLARIATAIGLHETVDILLNAPIVHLAEGDASRFTGARSAVERSGVLDRLAIEYLYRQKSPDQDAYVAPYSNNFLIHRRLFDMVGGYDERFRGHGSEDFEFLMRLQYYIDLLPLPGRPTEDLYGPTRDAFYRRKDYEGFRRLFEAMAFPAEMLGLRVFHLWHPRGSNDWRTNNDWKRGRLNAIFEEYVGRESRLLANDFLARAKKVICICRDPAHWGYFVPLRLAGFQLVPLFDGRDASVERAREMISSGDVAAIAIFNPYMKSHEAFKPLFMLARERGLRTIVVERGALPETIYYDDDVAYVSGGFSDEAFAAARFSEAELATAATYVDVLRRGGATLERQDTYEVTAERYPHLASKGRPVIFIPTQLDDDMAVTHFVRGEQSYAEFSVSLPEMIRAHPHVQFVVKSHPLSKTGDLEPAENLIVADRRDNIHFLIDAATAVIVYNSGVGLIAMLHGKPVFTIGNAFYNHPGAGHRSPSLAEAVRAATGSPASPSPEMTTRLAAWFALRKYSTFIADDDIREYAHRKSHNYAAISVTRFRWNGLDIPLGRQRQAMPLSNKSYIWARIGMATQVPKVAAPAWGPAKRGLHLVSRIAIAPFQSRRDQQRLRTDPIDFFSKARHPVNQFFGRLLLDPSERSY